MKISEEGGLQALCRGLSSRHEKVQMNSVGALCNLSLHDQENKGEIIACGVLPFLVELLNSKNEDLVRNVSNLLWNLSTLSKLSNF